MIPDKSSIQSHSVSTQTQGRHPRFGWLMELEAKALQLWENGEGDLKVEIRNSRKDVRGRTRRFVKIEANTIIRWEEQ